MTSSVAVRPVHDELTVAEVRGAIRSLVDTCLRSDEIRSTFADRVAEGDGETSVVREFEGRA